MNFEKNSFSRMKDPISRLKRGRQRIRRQVRLNAGGNNFSRILEMKLRFEIGRKLLRSSVDRDGFLRRGWTRACLNDDGKIPSERERLTRFVMIGPSSLKQSFRRKVGMESRGHCLLSEAEMSL